MQPERWKPILPQLEIFQSYLSDKVPNFQLIAATEKTWTDAIYKEKRPKGFPHSLRGIYFIFDLEGELLYIGVTMDCFDSRVWWHDNYERHFIDIIVLDDEFAFLAPSLEVFHCNSMASCIKHSSCESSLSWSMQSLKLASSSR